MTGFMSHYLLDKVQRALLGESFAVPTDGFGNPQIFAALGSTAPSAAAFGTELTGSGYDRILIPVANAPEASATGSVLKNSGTFSFPQASANWNAGAPIPYLGLFDAATGGNYLWAWILETSKIVLNGQTAQYGPNAVEFHVDEPTASASSLVRTNYMELAILNMLRGIPWSVQAIYMGLLSATPPKNPQSLGDIHEFTAATAPGYLRRQLAEAAVAGPPTLIKNSADQTGGPNTSAQDWPLGTTVGMFDAPDEETGQLLLFPALNVARKLSLNDTWRLAANQGILTAA
jgi:hypothetical protein